MSENLDRLDDLKQYRQLFTRVTFWEPFVADICQRHHLLPSAPVRIGIPGTCPTFIVGERWVVKFFGRLFDGATSFLVEREAGRLIALDAAIPTAQVIAQGKLRDQDWHWPYLVYRYLPGVSLGELAEQINQQDWQRIAHQLGQITRRIHALPLQGSTVFPADHSAYTRFLTAQRAMCAANHQAWGTLPAHLVAQIEDYLPAVESLVDHSRSAHLIHADLTRDHLLGRVVNGHWQTLGLIDFGDAMTGDVLYELVALHLDLFHGEIQWLHTFLDAYHLSLALRRDLPRKAMATTLLHQFNVLGSLPLEMLQVNTLAELASRLWGE
jgi:aminoglycoside phosphotransferase